MISIHGDTETGALESILFDDISQIETLAVAGAITVSESKNVDCVLYCIDLSLPIDVDTIKADMKQKCASTLRQPIVLVATNYTNDTTDNYSIFETLVLEDESLNIYSKRLVLSAHPTQENIEALKSELSFFMEEKVWSTYRLPFLQALRSKINQGFAERIDDPLTELKATWKAGSPDFEQFRESCQNICDAHLSAYQTPSMKNIFNQFLLGFVAGMLVTAALSIMLILAANLASLIGLLVVSAVNIKNIGVFATAVGGLSGVGMASSLFRPRVIAKSETELFISNLAPAPGA